MMLVAHPLGNACVRALLAGLHARGLLASYVTTLGFHQGDHWIGQLPASVRAQLERRRYDLPSALVERHPARESVRLASQALGLRFLSRHEAGWASVDAVFGALDRAAAQALARHASVRAVHAYEDGALATFRAARVCGLARSYELPMGYWRGAQEIFREEAELQPDWAATLDGLQDSPAKLARKDEELALATHVVVASEFSRRSLTAHPRGVTATVAVIPHGAPPAIGEAELKARLATRAAGPLRVLYVGGLTQRKGLSYLFAALQQLGGEAELTVVGRPGGRPCTALSAALARHTHIPSLAPHDLYALMRRHDVLVLPSLWEGFGLVLAEALAQGLPIVATPHTAAPDLLAGQHAGLIVPARSADALAAALHQLAADRIEREQMSLAARRVAELHSTEAWTRALGDYGQSLLDPAGPSS